MFLYGCILEAISGSTYVIFADVILKQKKGKIP